MIIFIIILMVVGWPALCFMAGMIPDPPHDDE